MQRIVNNGRILSLVLNAVVITGVIIIALSHGKTL
jgi:hypothetical protein